MPTTVFRGGAVASAATGHRPGWGVLVEDGRIARVAPDVALPDARSPGVEVVQLDGGLVGPGFHDAHCHPVMAGVELGQCDLSGAEQLDDVLARVRRYAREHPDEPWIVGGGWSLETFPGGTPRRELLDAIVPDRPVHLENRDHHGAWVNTRALELAGLHARTSDPADGRIERDPDGTPSGTLHEGAAALTGALRPPVDVAQARTALARAQRHLLALGVTGWQDAWLQPRSDGDDLDVYRAAAADGSLVARVSVALWWDRSRGLEQVPELLGRIEAAADLAPRVRVRTVKIMVDGIAENFTAAMTEPYRDACGHPTGNAGLSFVPPAVLAEAVTRFDAHGVQVHLHALGDRAVREGLDAVARARAVNGPGGPRHHLAHLQVVAEPDVPRFAALDAAANLQPLWACSEPQMDELTLPFLATALHRRQYPFAELHAAGAPLALGSDWPVSSADPLAGMHVAVTRRAPGASPDVAPFLPEQALPLDVVWTAATAGSAGIGGWGGELGDLLPGRAADLVVLDRDPFAGPVEEIARARVASTWVAGAAVHRA
ncbi:MAG TPA: amidohydrolase [Cellulomonas sp.]